MRSSSQTNARRPGNFRHHPGGERGGTAVRSVSPGWAVGLTKSSSWMRRAMTERARWRKHSVAGSWPIPQPHRARQMNLGAAQARGRILLFLHADTLLPSGALAKIVDAIDRRGAVGGAFSRRYRSRSFTLAADRAARRAAQSSLRLASRRPGDFRPTRYFRRLTVIATFRFSKTSIFHAACVPSAKPSP